MLLVRQLLFQKKMEINYLLLYISMSYNKLFTFGTVAHSILAVSYINKINDKHREKLLYLLAHIFITISMLVRVKPNNEGKFIPSLLGSIGHSLLLLFFIFTTFIFQSKYNIQFDSSLFILNLLCIIAQIGMILIYWVEYFEKNNNDKKLKNEEFFNYVKVITYSILGIFYFTMASRISNKASLNYIGLMMVFVLYVIALYNTVLKEKLN